MAIRNRVEKLEGEGMKNKPAKFLFMEQGETREACIKRSGFDPDDKSARYVIVTWLDVHI